MNYVVVQEGGIVINFDMSLLLKFRRMQVLVDKVMTY